MAASYEISMHAAMAAATALSELDFNFTLNKIQLKVPKAFLSGRPRFALHTTGYAKCFVKHQCVCWLTVQCYNG